MTLSSIGKATLTVTTGYGFRDFVKRHKKYAYLIGALIVFNEIRGIAVVWASYPFVWEMVKGWFA